MRTALFGVLASLVVAGQASAQLVITEVMSFSGSLPDWWEVTNFGAVPIDPTGYRMDDDSNLFANGAELLGIATILPGESVVYTEASAATVIPAFRTLWGGSAMGLPGVKVGSYSGATLSLSGTSGDQLHIFNAGGTEIAGVSFPASPTAFSFRYNPTTMTFGEKSVVGQFGAFASPGTPTHVGSPGTIGVPEPASLALAAFAMLGVRRFSRR